MRDALVNFYDGYTAGLSERFVSTHLEDARQHSNGAQELKVASQFRHKKVLAPCCYSSPYTPIQIIIPYIID